jgi:hypothetical protein
VKRSVVLSRRNVLLLTLTPHSLGTVHQVRDLPRHTHGNVEWRTM